MTFEVRYTTLRGDHRDIRRFDRLEEARDVATRAFRSVEEGGIDDVLAAHIYENPAPTLRMVVSAGNSLVHVTLIGPVEDAG